MQQTIQYQLDHRAGTVELLLDNASFIVRTQGNALLDKQQVVDIALLELEYYCLVPVIGIQRLQNARATGDHAFDSEFVFSFRSRQKRRIKRVFVNAKDPSFEALLDGLALRCPGASLLQLDPGMALKQMGVVSASRVTRFLLFFLIGLPAVIVLIYIIAKVIRN